jgi:ubiquinone/menaquinone biosynthesis C-methylase UbiE
MSHLSWLTKLYVLACQKLYHELAWSYDWVSWLISFGRWTNWRLHVLDYLPAPEQHGNRPYHLLEIGFGTGELLAQLSQRHFVIYGLELSPAMVGITLRKLRRMRAPAQCVQGCSQAMPFSDAFFDTIIATFPAPYILEPATLAECARLLPKAGLANCAQGGRLVVVGLTVALQPDWLQRIIPFFYGAPSPALAELVKSQFAKAGFAVEFATYQDGRFSISVIIAQKV